MTETTIELIKLAITGNEFNFIVPDVKSKIKNTYIRPEEYPENPSSEFIIVTRRHFVSYSREFLHNYDIADIPERNQDIPFRRMPKYIPFYYFVDEVEMLTRSYRIVFFDNPSVIIPIPSRIFGLSKKYESIILKSWEKFKKRPVLPSDMKFVENENIMDCGERPSLPDWSPFYVKKFDGIFGVFDSRDGLIVYRTEHELVANDRAKYFNDIS